MTLSVWWVCINEYLSNKLDCFILFQISIIIRLVLRVTYCVFSKDSESADVGKNDWNLNILLIRGMVLFEQLGYVNL